MDIPLGAVRDQDWIKRHEKFYYGKNAKEISYEEASSYSEAEQKEFAELCYVLNAEYFDRLKRNFNMEAVTCSMYRGGEDAIAFFSAGEDKERDNYPLGQLWPFHAELHPVANRIYTTGANISEAEHISSTVNGVEYLSVYTPVVIDGRMLAAINGSILWSKVRSEIETGTRKATIPLILIRLLAYLLLLYAFEILVIRPLTAMQGSVRKYTSEKNSEATREELSRFRKIHNEIGLLASDVSDMVSEIDMYVEEVQRKAAENERISTELSLAAEIQANALPSEFPPFPDRKEFEIYATMTPASNVGGDFFDYFMVGEDKLAMVVADTSGKGVSAALFTMVSKTIIKTLMQTHADPAKVLHAANDFLFENNEKCMFVTVWLGILDIPSGKLTFADAGHERLLIMHGGEWSYLEKKYTGIPLALMKQSADEYVNEELELSPGDALFQYTDGVTDARDGGEKMFGEDRLLDSLNSAASPEPAELLEHIQNGIHEFVQGAPQFDDITMLGMRYIKRR
ncbi:MAG: PP2C family protein-serine/threonine phosphatase [Lachnospiraceae bacterium]|nr:PP2C family protein-serine/threonine phosphatase [Lachnospiraceae bacterium]